MLNSEIGSWVDNYGDMLYGFAIKRVNDSDEVRDLVQDTFMAALKSKERFRGESSEKTWLFGVLKHKIYDYYRKKAYLAGKKVSYDSELDGTFTKNGQWSHGISDWEENPEKNLENGDFLREIRKSVDKLPEIQKHVFICRVIEGQETKEICDQLNISETNFHVILYRARLRLRKYMSKNWFEKS